MEKCKIRGIISYPQFEKMVNKKKILFVCTGNSCRSQIAHGLMNEFAGEKFEIYSAGFSPSKVHPMAIKVMNEIDIDISNHTSDLSLIHI